MPLAAIRRAAARIRRARARPDSWSIVATVREPRTLVKAFVAHHLGLGVGTIHLFFDDPLDTAADAVEGLDRVSVVRCDAAHWRQFRHGRPKDARLRLSANANWVYQRCRDDWLCLIDCDEFLVSRDRIGRVLAVHGRDAPAVRVLPAERVFTPDDNEDEMVFDGLFKRNRLAQARLGEQLYGAVGRCFLNGFQGHTVGKLFTRTGQPDIRIRLHSLERDGRKVKAVSLDDEEILLAHFLPTGFADWRYKYERREGNKAYYNGLRQYEKNRYDIYRNTRARGGEAGLRRLFTQLSVLNERQQALLRSNDLLLRLEFDLEARCAAVFPPSGLQEPEFRHVRPATKRRPRTPKVFQIGMCNCGTRDLCLQFARRGMGYAHFDGGRLAEAADNRSLPALEEFDRLTMFANILKDRPSGEVFAPVERVAALAEAHPDAAFILNFRGPENWADSLLRKLDAAAKRAVFARFDCGSDAACRRALVSAWQHYREQVKALLSEGHSLIETNIDKEKPGVVFRRLEELKIR